MNTGGFGHVKAGEGRVIDFFGHSMDFRRTGSDCFIMIDTVPPGQGVPMHRHGGWTEFFERFCEAVLEEIGEEFDPARFGRIAARFDTEFLGPVPD